MIESIINRVSCGRLEAPAPSKEHLELMFKAALRAPDHRSLKPWEYIVFEGEEALNRFGDYMVQASLKDNPEMDEEAQQKLRGKPHRAPMVIVAVAKAQNHPKVPHVEEILSTGAGVQNLILGAYDLGYGAYWRTGSLAFNDHMKAPLGLDYEDTIVGFIYLGTPAVELKAKPVPEIRDFVRRG